MTWNTLTGKFSKEQLEIINEYKIKYGLNNNRLIKRALEDLLEISVADATRKENQGLPIEYLPMYYFYEYLKKEFKDSPKVQNQLRDAFDRYRTGFWRIWTSKQNLKLDEAHKKWTAFKEHKKVGRKKNTKGLAGRPLDTGLHKQKLCGKGHNNWSSWTSTDGKVHRYCKTCRQERARRYNERKNNAKGSHTKREFEEKLKLYEICPECGRRWEDIPFSKGTAKYKITEDHIIPLLKGGTDDIDNIQPLCYQCNFKKGHSKM